MRNTFIKTLVEEAEKNSDIFLITPDLGFSVLEEFQEKFPDRFLNTGIAEQNAVGVAAGLALSGKVVYVYSIVPFITMRCFEQIRVDVAYMKTNVRLIGVGAGLSYGPAGATHHAIEDIAIMRALPNMTVCCPGDPIEAKRIAQQSVTYDGPIYIRLAKNGEPQIHKRDQSIKIGEPVSLSKGKDVAIFVTSNMLETAHNITNRLKAVGLSVVLVSVHTVKPIEFTEIDNIISQQIPTVTLEEHNIIGGLGSIIAERIAESGRGLKFKRIGIPDAFSHFVGSQTYIREKYDLSEEKVYKNILSFINS